MVANDVLAVSLHRALEQGLDSGKIVILPIFEDNTELSYLPSRWKCMLTDVNCGKETLLRYGGQETKWQVSYPRFNFTKCGLLTSPIGH
jgi:hypothetical protein